MPRCGATGRQRGRPCGARSARSNYSRDCCSLYVHREWQAFSGTWPDVYVLTNYFLTWVFSSSYRNSPNLACCGQLTMYCALYWLSATSNTLKKAWNTKFLFYNLLSDPIGSRILFYWYLGRILKILIFTKIDHTSIYIVTNSNIASIFKPLRCTFPHTSDGIILKAIQCQAFVMDWLPDGWN